MKLSEAMNRLVDICIGGMTPSMASLRVRAEFFGSAVLPRVIVVVFFLGYVAAQSPHLVHHLFEPDELQPDCAYLAAGDRHQGAPVEVPLLFSESAPISAVALAIESCPIAHDPGPTSARAPPATS